MNTDFDILYNLVNGQINTANIEANAGILGSQLATNAGINGSQLSDPAIYNQQIQANIEAGSIAGTDKCQFRWGVGTDGYTRIIQKGDELLITKNLGWDGTNWNLDNTSYYGYILKFTAETATDNAINAWFATPGANPRTLVRYTSIRPSPTVAGSIQIVLGQDKDGADPVNLDIIRWIEGAYVNLSIADLNAKNINAKNVKLGRGSIIYDGTGARRGGIISSIARSSTGVYNVTLDGDYGSTESTQRFAATVSQRNIGFITVSSPGIASGQTYFHVSTYDTSGTTADSNIDVTVVADVYDT